MLGWCGIRGLFREKSFGGKDSSGPMENSRIRARIPDGERLRWGRSLFSFATAPGRGRLLSRLMKLAGDFARVVAIQQPARFGGGAGMRHLRSLWIEYAKIRWHGDERAIVGLGRESVAQVRRECVFK